MKKILCLIIMMIMIMGLNGCKTNVIEPLSNSAYQTNSLDELIDLVEERQSLFKENRYDGIPGVAPKSQINEATDDSLETTSNSDDYTKTNTQTENVDEGDIIKVDGSYIYKLSTNGFVIVKVDNGQMSIVTKIDIENYVPQEMYVQDDMLVLIGGIYPKNQTDGWYNVISPDYDYWEYWSYNITDIRLYDITDRSNLVLVENIQVEGYFETSRIVDKKLVYLVSKDFNYTTKEDTKDYLPKYQNMKTDLTMKNIDIENIYHFKSIIECRYLIIGSMTLESVSETEIKAYVGIGGLTYCSENNLYIATSDYRFYWYDYELENQDSKVYTHLTRISYETLLCTGTVKIEGTLNDKYNMDEYDGYFRIVSTTQNWWNSNKLGYSTLYILNDELSEVGRIDNIAPGERVYSVRFNGNTGSLVTFQQIDPLFKLNLEDPNNPTISKGLKEDGVSMYLHYIEGTDYVIGLGRDTEFNQYGGVVWKGLKVSLYDMSSGEAVNVSTITIGDACSYTEALYNPKAILYDKKLNIFAFAAESWIYESDYNYSMNRQGLYVFGFDKGVLTERAILSNIDKFEYSTYNEYYQLSSQKIQRGVRIGDYIYTISDTMITSYLLADFSKASQITIGNIPEF